MRTKGKRGTFILVSQNLRPDQITFLGGLGVKDSLSCMFALACVHRASVAVVALTAEAVGAQVLLPRVLREGLAARHRRHGLSGRGQHAA